MRFMILLKSDESTEAGTMPSEEILAEMGRYNEELVKAGVMLAGEGLHPSSKGARVKFSQPGSTDGWEGSVRSGVKNDLLCRTFTAD